ncbi:RNA 2',3'-cyclic phosphodiesterase [Candidatus Dojkabacteria bacterium]|nr:RNA 2',3'-cyclic phosphodiesterase [Candidatus Dojkabacteria bacterium]
MRLFITILPPQEIKEKIRDITRLFYKEKRNLTFVKPEHLHITIKFLGNNVSKESLDRIIEYFNLYKRKLKKASIEFNKIYFGFKGETRPTVLSCLVNKNKELDLLVHTVHSFIKELKLEDTGRKKDRATLINHMTIARAKPTVNRNFKKKIHCILEGVEKKKTSFTANSISILQSTLTNQGPVYKEISRFELS